MRADHFLPAAWRARATVFLLAVGAAIWLTACFGEGPAAGGKVAGGTGSEAGDAYGVARSIGGESSSPFARVSLYHSADSLFAHPEPYADTLADSMGHFHFLILKAGKYDLEIRARNGRGLLFRSGIDLAVPGETDLGENDLTEPAKFRDRLPALPASATRIWLAGTPYSATVDASGSFSFDMLPKGNFLIFSERSVGDTLERIVLGKMTLLPGDSLAPPDSIMTPPADTGKPVIIPPADTVGVTGIPVPGQYLIEDFNDSDAVSNYGRLGGMAKWNCISVELTSMKPFSSATFGSSQTSESTFLGKSLKVEYATTHPDLAKAIVHLPMFPVNPNLKTADTLIFHAKGSGSLLAQVDLVFSTRTLEGGGQIALTPDWMEYRIPIKEKVGSSGPSFTDAIRFTGMHGSSFSLDNIIMTGTTFKSSDAR
jgi:hypothetical protein